MSDNIHRMMASSKATEYIGLHPTATTALAARLADDIDVHKRQAYYAGYVDARDAAEADTRATVRVVLDEVHHCIDKLSYSSDPLLLTQRYIKELISHYQEPIPKEEKNE